MAKSGWGFKILVFYLVLLEMSGGWLRKVANLLKIIYSQMNRENVTSRLIVLHSREPKAMPEAGLGLVSS